jgi:hypothetical protein
MGVRYDQSLLLDHYTFRNTVAMAAIIHARGVLREPDTTSLHEVRHALAEVMLRRRPGDRDAIVYQFALALATREGQTAKVVKPGGAVDAAVFVDADFDSTVAAEWTNVAQFFASSPDSPAGV